MSRASSFAFKGRAIETDQVARRLGVRYMLTGSVRRSRDHVRISVQLTDAETGGSLWAERYDRDVVDVLTLQDEIAEAVAGSIEPELLKTESQRGAEKPQSMAAWDLVRRGMWEFHKIEPEGHRLARELFLKAIEAEPGSADGYIWLSRAETGLAAYGWSTEPEATRQSSMAAGLKAAQLDPKNPYAHYAVAISHLFASEVNIATRAARQTVALSPSFALGHLVLGAAFLHAGQPKEAVEPLEHGMRLSPYDPQNFVWLLFLAVAHAFSGNSHNAIEAAQRSLSLRPGWAAALKVEIMGWVALGDLRRARSLAVAIPPLRDAPSDLSPIIGKLNPAWIEQIERAVHQAREGR
jgi:adenylate cyclase